MATRKFYCHKCGGRLVSNARTRTVKCVDPDYCQHSLIGRGKLVFFDTELTEHDFKCGTCDSIISADEQYVFEKMQKMLGKRVLTDKEVAENKKARNAIAKKSKKTNIVVKMLYIILALLVLWATKCVLTLLLL